MFLFVFLLLYSYKTLFYNIIIYFGFIIDVLIMLVNGSVYKV